MHSTENTPNRSGAVAAGPAPPVFELWGDSSILPQARKVNMQAVALFLRRQALWIVVVACLVAILCASAITLLFNQYVATATLLFDPRNAKVTDAQEVLPEIGPDSIAIESLVQVAKSDGFLAKLIEREGLAADSELDGGAASTPDQKAAALDRLRDRLTIARRGATYVVDISMKSADAQKSARIANAAANMMIDSEADLRAGSNQRAVDFIGGKLAQLRQRVSDEDAAIAKLKTDLKITDAGQGDVLQARRVTELNQQLVLASAHSETTRAIVDQLREANLSVGDALPASIQSLVLNGLREQYARLTREAADRETILGARHPDVIAANAQIGDVRRQIAAEKDRLISSAKADYQEARKREALLTDALHKAQAESGATDQDSVQLRDLERNEKSDQAVYEQLLSRQKELAEMKGVSTDGVRLVSSALTPTRANRPRMSLVLAASGLIGLLAGLASALARDARRPRSDAATPLERALGIETAATLPMFSPPPARDGRLAKGEAARLFAALGADVGPKRAILVTSAREGEGKSTVAANLAASLASEGAKVLLMQLAESAVVRPRRRLGLAAVAADECVLEEAVLWYGEDAPSILPLGNVAGGALAALLSGSALRRIIHRCRRLYDVLVIDGPPLPDQPALRDLAVLVDRMLLVVDTDQADPDRLAQTLDGFDKRKIQVVFNKAPLAGAASAPAGATSAAPIAPERHASAFAGLAESTRRMGRRRSASGRAG
jgi:succinoglycan biosynthesis transport protein ExoP